MTDVHPEPRLQPDDAAFRAAMADLPAAVSIVTTTAPDGTPRGATVSAISSLSASPAMLLVCLDQGSDTLAALGPGRPFLVHVVADGQQDHAMRMAGKGAGKFEDTAWRTGLSGQPQLEGAAIVFGCRVTDFVPGGDHTIVLGTIEAIEHDPGRQPIVYHRRKLAPAPTA
ncbi:flavin reductase family protein [Streptomyces shenzhenensis]|uniref:flavin reductase family protein n=1 Tax=Streptomyces shenzhenensis TaxID=943815 RepID=UPI0036C2B8A0